MNAALSYGTSALLSLERLCTENSVLLVAIKKTRARTIPYQRSPSVGPCLVLLIVVFIISGRGVQFLVHLRLASPLGVDSQTKRRLNTGHVSFSCNSKSIPSIKPSNVEIFGSDPIVWQVVRVISTI